MKLAEALIERKALTERITQLQARVGQNAVVRAGEPPSEDPIDLFAQVGELVKDLGNLIKSINRTNNEARIETGETISEAIVSRDMLKMRMTQIEYAIAQASNGTRHRYGAEEVKMVAAMDVATLRKGQDEFSKEYRVLDTLIQAANWGSDLV